MKGEHLETLRERDKRIARERRNRRLWKATGYIAAFAFGAMLAGTSGLVHGFNRGVQHERVRAELNGHVRRASPPPAHALTQWDCSEHEFREHMGACEGRVPRWYRFIKPKG